MIVPDTDVRLLAGLEKGPKKLRFLGKKTKKTSKVQNLGFLGFFLIFGQILDKPY